jgi:hypothetical protein
VDDPLALIVISALNMIRIDGTAQNFCSRVQRRIRLQPCLRRIFSILF